MARPIKNRKLKHIVSFRLDDEEHAKWLAKVEASNLPKSEFFRQSVIENRTTVMQSDKPKRATRRVLPKPSSATTMVEKKVLFLLAQLSNNVNQIAHRLNSDHKAGVISTTTYIDILNELTIISSMSKPWELT